jgi:6-phosphogluconolactonase
MKTYFKTQIMLNAMETSERLAMDMVRYIQHMVRYRDSLYIAISGGSTPRLLYEIVSQDFSTALDWSRVHFFWVDERCVPANDPESNYGTANSALFSKIAIPHENLHPIHGTEDPLNEIVRYTGEILSIVPCNKNFPVFDLILLGLGNDGHTASIFPGQLNLFETNSICTVTQHPETKQKRITLTGPVINNASEIVFLVTGNQKAEKVKSIIHDEIESLHFPAKKIVPVNGNLSWYLDKDSAYLIQNK